MKLVMTFDNENDSDYRQLEIIKQASNMYYALMAFDAYLHEDCKTSTTMDEVRAKWSEIHRIYSISYDL